MPPGFHLLGAGALGCLFAQHLQRAGVPVTLLLRSSQRLQQFLAQGCRITVELPATADQPATTSTSLSRAELICPEHSCDSHATPHTISSSRMSSHASNDANSPISRLLVATKANQTLEAVAAIRHRLHSDSVVVLLQNGVLAVQEQLLTELFPHPPTRPVFVLGSTTHGAYRRDTFHVVHAGAGSCLFGQLPDGLSCSNGSGLASSALDEQQATHSQTPHRLQEQQLHDPQQQQQQPDSQQQPEQQRKHQQQQVVEEALSLLALATELQPCIALPPEELQQQLLRKLVVNCCCNPVAALLGCRNGGLLNNPPVASAWEGIIGECKGAFGEELLPASAAELAAHVAKVASATSGNINSMLQDVLAGAKTEVDYLNGYVVRRAAAKGVAVPWNTAMAALVHGREACTRDMLQGVGASDL